MTGLLTQGVVFGYLVAVLGLGIFAGLRGRSSVSDFVAGERSFGPILMYFIMGGTIFSAFALLGTPQRVVEKGSDSFYVLAYGAFGFIPVFFFGGKVRRLGARLGHVTQAELIGDRFTSRGLTGAMGIATVVAFVPYLVIQLKAADIVMHAVTGWPRGIGAAVVYGVVTIYVALGGVRGVGWTNVFQGAAMMVIVWVLGLWAVTTLHGGVEGLFDAVIAARPDTLVLPGPGHTSPWQWSSEILVSALGFAMWPQIFMRCFTARSARLVRLTAVLYPTFLLFLVPLLWLGYIAVLHGGPPGDGVLLWLFQLPELEAHGLTLALVAFAVLAASMSTGDALLHAAGSIVVRDVMVRWLGWRMDDRTQTTMIRVLIVGLAFVSWQVLVSLESISIVDLLLLAYAVPIQFAPLVFLGLYWRRANRAGAIWGLGSGLSTVLFLFVLQQWFPVTYEIVNPLHLQIGVCGGMVNLAVMLAAGWAGPPMGAAHLREYEL